MCKDSTTLLDDRGLPRGLFFSARIAKEGKAKRGALLMLKMKLKTPNKEGKTALATSISLAGAGFYEAYTQAVEALLNFMCDEWSPEDLRVLQSTADAFVEHYGLKLKTIQILVDD